jgi:NTP pyrophosphatase (non-canonical NTP hydrolase)
MLDDDGAVDLERGEYYVERFATEEEKQKLFDAIKANGYKWNAETKTLDKLIEPSFKVGDKVRHKNNHGVVFTITSIEEDSYVCGTKAAFWFDDQDNYELVSDKFDNPLLGALATFGAEHQRMMCIEECAELIDALAKYDRGRADTKDVITELADVCIMVEQMAMLFGKEEFEKEKERKLKRLQKKIDEASNL